MKWRWDVHPDAFFATYCSLPQFHDDGSIRTEILLLLYKNYLYEYYSSTVVKNNKYSKKIKSTYKCVLQVQVCTLFKMRDVMRSSWRVGINSTAHRIILDKKSPCVGNKILKIRST